MYVRCDTAAAATLSLRSWGSTFCGCETAGHQSPKTPKGCGLESVVTHKLVEMKRCWKRQTQRRPISPKNANS